MLRTFWSHVFRDCGAGAPGFAATLPTTYITFPLDNPAYPEDFLDFLLYQTLALNGFLSPVPVLF